MVPDNKVRFTRFSLAGELRTSALGFSACLVAALVTTAGCRTPWASQSQSEPSFDRLMEIENSSTSMPPSFHPQVNNRRPGIGNASPAKFPNGDIEPAYAQSPYAPPAEGKYAVRSRRISDMDESAPETSSDLDLPPNQLQLLRDTQTALKNKANKNLLDASEDFDTDAPLPPRGKRESDGKTAFRLNDDAQDSQGQPRKFADSSTRPNKPKSNQQEVNQDSPVHRAAGESEGRDRSVQSAYAEAPVLDLTADSKSKFDKNPIEKELTWEQHLQRAMKQIAESEDETLESPQARMRMAVVSRLLALSLNDRESMLEAIKGLQPDEQDYLNYQMTAIFDAIDPEAHPTSSRKWSLVMVNQKKADAHLASLSNLEIKNLSFCSEVVDFGVTTPFGNSKFKPGEEVLLYLELDNFVSEKSKDGKGFETQLQGSYEIKDSAGRRVADQTLPADTHVCKNIRRDYFIAYRIYMPQNISTGSYKLNLSVEDLKGRKFGNATIDFQIQ